MRDRMRRIVATLLPWYDVAEADRREQRAERIRQRSIRTRIHSEQVLAQYREMDARIGRMSGRT